MMNEAATAKLILSRICKGDLAGGFTARDIQRKQWSGLSENDAIKTGLDLLVDLDWIRAQEAGTGGRPSVKCAINPRAGR